MNIDEISNPRLVPIINPLACVYLLVQSKEIVYVGQTTNLPARIARHIDALDKEFDSIYMIEWHDKDIVYLESLLIRFARPKYNKTLSKQKAPLSIDEQNYLNAVLAHPISQFDKMREAVNLL